MPIPARRGGGIIGGSWGAYYYNGLVYSSELARGLDILELLPSAQLSANELAAAKLIVMDEFNPQSQPKLKNQRRTAVRRKKKLRLKNPPLPQPNKTRSHHRRKSVMFVIQSAA